jgi:hypothetical protein
MGGKGDEKNGENLEWLFEFINQAHLGLRRVERRSLKDVF